MASAPAFTTDDISEGLRHVTVSCEPQVYAAIPSGSSRAQRQDALSDVARDHLMSPRQQHDIHPFINHLPNELLLKIFGSISQNPQPTPNLVVTHVCSRWRSIAIAVTSFWTWIDFSRPMPFARLFVERSGDASLKLFSFKPCALKHSLAIILMCQTRIIWLQYGGAKHGIASEVINDLLASCPTLPRLWVLQVESSQPCDHPYPAQLRRSPLLRVLCIRGMGFSWLAASMRGLLHLSLTDPKVRPGTLDKLLDALDMCPDLISLALSYALTRVRGAHYPPPSRIVSLRQLERLVISDFPPEISNFCSHLSIPATAQVILKCTCASFSFDVGRTIGPSLSLRDVVPRYNRDRWLVYSLARNVDLYMAEQDGIHMQVMLEPNPAKDAPAVMSIHLPLHRKNVDGSELYSYITFSETIRQCVTLFSPALARLSLRGDKTGRSTLSFEEWRSALLKLPLLEHLQVTGVNFHEALFNALAVFVPTRGILCSRLESLDLEGGAYDSFALESMHACFGSRVNSGHRLKSLRLRGFVYFDESWNEDVAVLRQTIDIVECDAGERAQGVCSSIAWNG